MSQEFQIRRLGGPISLGAWIEVVQSMPGLRLSAGGVAHNPRTGAEVRVPAREGDVEMFFPKENRWALVFRWKNTISFKASSDSTVMRTAFDLAAKLDAQIVQIVK